MKRILFLMLAFLPVVVHATVTNQSTSVSFTCTGSVGPYPFTFPISDPTAMIATQNGTVLLTTAYTIAPVNNNYTNGGSVTLNTACPSGGNLFLLRRVTPLTQTTVFTDNMPVPMKSFERGLDKLTEIVQEQSSSIDGVPFCSGFSPTVGQTVEYSAPLNSIPCWKSATLVTSVIPGFGISVSPTGGTGDVTISTAPTQLCPPSGNCIIAGNLNVTGTVAANTVLPSSLDSMRFASQFSGSNCGAKVNSAFVGFTGEVWVSPSLCGYDLSGMSIPDNSGVMLEPSRNYTVSTAGISVATAGALMSATPATVLISASIGPATVISQANGSNLASMISLNGYGASITGIDVEGNAGNNPTGGVCVVANLAARVLLQNGSASECRTHGVWIKSTGLNIESTAATLLNFSSIGNYVDGVRIDNTADVKIDGAGEYEGNGTPKNGIGISPNTVTVSGLTNIAITAGIPMSPDISMIGECVRIGSAPGIFAPIATIASNGLSFTVGSAPNNCSNTPLANGSGQPMTYGEGIGLYDSPTLRLTAVDVGGNQLGLLAVCTTGGLGNYGNLLGDTVQFGAQYEEDIYSKASISVTTCSSSGQQTRIDSSFAGGLNVPDAVYPTISLVDSGSTSIIGGFRTQTSPHRNTTAVQVTETNPGESQPGYFQINADPNFSAGPLLDSTENCAQAFVNNGGDWEWMMCQSPSATLHLHDTSAGDSTPDKFFRVSSGKLQILSSGFTQVIATLDDSGNLLVPASITANGFPTGCAESLCTISSAYKTSQTASIGTTNLPAFTGAVGQQYFVRATLQTTTAGSAGSVTATINCGNATASISAVSLSTLAVNSTGISCLYQAGQTYAYSTTVTGNVGGAYDIGVALVRFQ